MIGIFGLLESLVFTILYVEFIRLLSVLVFLAKNASRNHQSPTFLLLSSMQKAIQMKLLALVVWQLIMISTEEKHL